MSPTAAHPTVVVIGAGITGLATARELARRGLAATVLDTAPLGTTGASARSLAWLNAFGTEHEGYARFRAASMAAYRELAGTPAGRFVHLDGALWWPPTGHDAWPTARQRLHALGYAVEELSVDEARSRFPDVSFAGAGPDLVVHVPHEGWADLPGLVTEFAADVEAAGGRVVAGAGPVRVRWAGDRVAGVALDDGTVLAADAVVVAAGGATPGRVAQDTGFEVPVDEQVGLLVRTRPFAGAPRVVLNTPGVSMRPDPSGGVAFDTDWPADAVTLAEHGGYRVDEDAVRRVTDAARRVLTDADGLDVADLGVGVKPMPADGFPVVGSVPGTTGYHVAFTHSGATNALGIASRLADLVLDGTPVPSFMDPARLRATV